MCSTLKVLRTMNLRTIHESEALRPDVDRLALLKNGRHVEDASNQVTPEDCMNIGDERSIANCTPDLVVEECTPVRLVAHLDAPAP